MKNQEIVTILNNMADLLEIQQVQWKPQAYRTAARSIEVLSEDIEKLFQIGKLRTISGVGEHIEQKISEYLITGKIKAYEKLKKETKIDIEGLHKIVGLGPRKIKILNEKLGVKNIKDLKKVIEKNKLVELPGFSNRTQEILLQEIQFLEKKFERLPRSMARPIVRKILSYFRNISGVVRVEVAGSFRRKQDTIGDLDFLVESGQPMKVIDGFVKMKGIEKVLVKGATKVSVRLEQGLQVDLRVVRKKEFGAALLYFTGNKAHNIRLRTIASKKSLRLNEYGLFTVVGKKWVAGRTEEEIYKKLGLEWIKPEKRLG